MAQQPYIPNVIIKEVWQCYVQLLIMDNKTIKGCAVLDNKGAKKKWKVKSNAHKNAPV